MTANFFFKCHEFLLIMYKLDHTTSMSNSIEVMTNLAYVKIIAMEQKKELFKYFTMSSSNLATENPRPTTPIMVLNQSESSSLKRPLNSPGSPQRRKRDIKVSQSYYKNFTINFID